MTKSRRFLAVDILFLLLAILPMIFGMTLKILTTPLPSGIEITGAKIYFSVPMPIQDLLITESQVNSLLVVISVLGICLYMTHGISVRAQTKSA